MAALVKKLFSDIQRGVITPVDRIGNCRDAGSVADHAHERCRVEQLIDDVGAGSLAECADNARTRNKHFIIVLVSAYDALRCHAQSPVACMHCDILIDLFKQERAVADICIRRQNVAHLNRA